MGNPLEQSDLPLSEKLGHVLSRIGVAMRADSWELTTKERLNPTQGQILMLLARRPSGIRLGEIASELAVSPPTVSDSIATLIDKGLVQKQRALDDGRAIAVTLLPPGVEMATKLDTGGPALRTALEKLAVEEREELFTTLLKLVRQLQVAERIPVARMCLTCRYFRPKVHEDIDRPHHCALVDAAFGDRTLRADCPEHEVADGFLAQQNWSDFVHGG